MSWRLSELTLDERRRTTNIYNVRQSTSRAINELNRDVLGMLEEAKVTQINPHKCRGYMQTGWEKRLER